MLAQEEEVNLGTPFIHVTTLPKRFVALDAEPRTDHRPVVVLKHLEEDGARSTKKHPYLR